MVVLRDEDRDALQLVPVNQSVRHLETRRHFGNGALERSAVGQKLARVEANPLKEEPGRCVRVLIGVEDVGAVPEQHLSQGGDNATPVWTRNEQCTDVFSIGSRWFGFEGGHSWYPFFQSQNRRGAINGMDESATVSGDYWSSPGAGND